MAGSASSTDESRIDLYSNLGHEDFDAIVTGDMTHWAIWLEGTLIDFLTDYFSKLQTRRDFERVLMRRDGLTFQDKIEIVRAILPSFANKSAAEELKKLLKKVELYKAERNALAHGLDDSKNDGSNRNLKIAIVSRSGKEKVVTVTPRSHHAKMKEAEALLNRLKEVCTLLLKRA